MGAGGTRLTADYRETPLWWDGTAFPRGHDGRPAARCDVAIVGAGYTGLSAALELARAGLAVTVLEARELGAGASGRNGGMVHPGLQHDIATLERRHGDLGTALHQTTEDAYAHVAAVVAAERIDCDLTEGGWVELAHRPSRVAELRASERLRRDRLAEPTHLVRREDIASETRCQGYFGALVTDRASLVQPARYLSGLARAALEAGARVHERTRVLRVERRGAGHRLTTTGGPVDARETLVATNGYTDGAVPTLHHRIIPIGSYIIATEPLPPALAAEVSPRPRMFTDTRDFLFYWRLSGDLRMVFGGRTSFAPITLGQARDRLHAAMLRSYPQLGGVRLSHAWTGTVGFTRDRLPHLGRLDGITYAMGYCGSGVAMGSWFGVLAARWIAGGEAPAIARLPFPTVPLYRGRPWFLPAVGWYHQLRDRF